MEGKAGHEGSARPVLGDDAYRRRRGRAVIRALFSLAASCYIIAALVFPGLWLIDDARLAPAAWWPAYLALELVLLGAPITYAVWQLVWAPAAALQAIRPTHLARLVLAVLLVVYGFLVIPAACFISLPHRVNLVAGCLSFAAAALVALLYLTYVRRASGAGR